MNCTSPWAFVAISLVFVNCQDSGNNKVVHQVLSKQSTNSNANFQKLVLYSSVNDSLLNIEFNEKSIPKWESSFFDYDKYNSTNILTFRGGYQRNSPVIGKLSMEPKSMELYWSFQTDVDTVLGKYGYWGGGAGWTGQPLLLNWTSKECKSMTSLFEEYRIRQKGLIEIVQVSLSGKVYFIDLETGENTRNPIVISNPIKGTPSVDPKKRFLLVGQGIANREGFHWRCYDLKNCTLIHKEKTPSNFALKGWGAMDASPLINKDGKFIWPTESGVIYFGQVDSGNINDISQARYRMTPQAHQGIESSPSAIANLVYFTDNGGLVFCFDLKTMKPRWHFSTGEDNDATPVIDLINGVPSIYIGNEVDLQGKRGLATFSKINGLTGEVAWKYSLSCNSEFGKKPNSGGILSTCCVGKGKLSSYVWTVFSRLDSSLSGRLVCFNKESGIPEYVVNLRQYSWVSPILLYDQSGTGFLYLADVGGNVYLINAETGEIIFKKNIGMTFESSPIAWKNFIIQPARGNRILCFQLK